VVGWLSWLGLLGWLKGKKREWWGVERSIRGSQGSILGTGVTEFSETNTVPVT